MSLHVTVSLSTSPCLPRSASPRVRMGEASASITHTISIPRFAPTRASRLPSLLGGVFIVGGALSTLICLLGFASRRLLAIEDQTNADGPAAM